MNTLLRLLLVMLVAAGTGGSLIAAPASSKGKKSSHTDTSVKKTAPAKSETPAQKTTPAAPADEDETPPAPVMTPAVVSTISIEDISGFEHYPKQIQSLVQSCLALTHLELGYLYGSSEPSKGGMDCSGTVYHVLHFQGLKDVPRQSDEMCQWVDKKTQLHLTPTATSFGSEEFDALKPGDLLFWTNTTATTRKLPVTHVMIYLGKVKKSGRRIVFGSSDGRSFHGERRSGVSVFDFNLPRAESTSHFYGYGPSPGLLPVEPERPVIAAMTPPPASAPVSKETPVVKATAAAKESPTVKETSAPKVVASVTKESPAPKVVSKSKESPAPKAPPPAKVASATQEPSAPKEEIRKAVAVTIETPPESASKKTVVADAKTDAPTKASTTAKPKTATAKKHSTTVASNTRRRTPAGPPKSVFEQKMDRAVSSVRRFFQQ